MSDKMREEFEKWALTECFDLTAVGGFYSDNETDAAYKAWQACAARMVPDGWIPVSVRLPESDVSFLAVTECAGDIYISTMRLPVLISKNSKPDGDFIRERVTHWMPLPAAPEPKK